MAWLEKAANFYAIQFNPELSVGKIPILHNGLTRVRMHSVVAVVFQVKFSPQFISLKIRFFFSREEIYNGLQNKISVLIHDKTNIEG